ncbi:MAG TPA: sulfatase-like hydrolase/transferase [Acidobacteriaceae bacterium]|nr:sulfatase-like hydrolase/transferase [Acidobacteriaceae bacterium]
MNRRKFISLMSSGIAVAKAPSILGSTPRRPNFLVLIADDMTFRAIHTLNNPEVETPHLDRLVDNGCAFTHCFHQGAWEPAVCTPSRYMLNTGLTAFHARQLVDQTPLWGEVFGQAGYDTYFIGKWGVTQPSLKRSFRDIGREGPMGMFVSGPTAYDRPSPGNTWTPWDTSLKGHWLHTNRWENARHDEIKHSAQIWADGASDYLLKQAHSVTPFFMYVGFNSPHDPRQSPKEFVDRYPKERVEIPPNYLPEFPFDQGDHRGRDELLAPFPRTREAVQLHRSEYYALITYMDAQIGRILDALERSGRAADTYIIFTADHGLAVGQHGLMGKQNLFDHSIRMPLLISGPGIAKGKKIDAMVYQHCLFATTCDLAGIAIPKTVEFPSLADLITGSSEREKYDAIFSYMEWNMSAMANWLKVPAIQNYRMRQRTVRTRTHKLIIYPLAGMTQLFDLEKDPWEIHDLADKHEHAALKSSLRKRLVNLQRELGDNLVLPQT